MPRQTTFRPFPPRETATDRARDAQLSEWLRVPHTSVSRLTFDHIGSNSATNVDISTPSATIKFQKLRDSTRLVFDLRVSGYAAGAGTNATWAVRFNSTDYDVAYHVFGVANVHFHASGIQVVDNVNAGLYTVTLRWRQSASTSCDANDLYILGISETNVPPDQ